MICVLGAVRQEISMIRGGMSGRRHHKLGRADAWRGTWQGREILLVRTGIGRVQAGEALKKVFASFEPSLLISTGYAGSADPALKIGDIVIADRVVEFASGAETDFSSLQPVNEFRMDQGWIDKASTVPAPEGASVRCGGLLTVARPLCDPQGKKAAGEMYRVQAVEMETASLIAGAGKVPFVSVRSISDTVEEELIDVSPFIGSDGEVSRLQAGWHVLTHPGKIGNVLTLRDHASRATQTLTHFLKSFVKTLPQT